jgi:hypothetical protein
VVSGAFYYRLDVYNLRKLLLQTQFLSNYPTIIILLIFVHGEHKKKLIRMYSILFYIRIHS